MAQTGRGTFVVTEMNSAVKVIKEMIAGLRAAARVARRTGDWTRCWQLLEDAHVLSQPWVWSHVQVHASMVAAGWKARDSVEVRGQLLRMIVGGPASAIGRYPVGNTGRARIPATRAMPIRRDLAAMLDQAGQRTA